MSNLIARLRACCVISTAVLGVHCAAIAQEFDESLTEASTVDSLYEFVNTLMAVQPSLRSAQAALGAAEANERSASRPIYNPDLEFDYEDAADETIEIGISQTVDWAGKKKAAHAASTARRLASEVEYQIARNQFAAQVLELLTEFWSAVEFQRLTASSVDLMHDFAQQAQLRYSAGDMTQVEYETAVLAYTEVRMRQAVTAANLAEAIRELVTLGARQEVRSWPRMPGTLPALTIQPGNVDYLLDQLPELAAANARVAAASAEVDLSKRLKKPDPTFGVRVGEEDNESLIGFSFSIPLYVRNTFNEDVLASLALRSQAEADAKAIEREARSRLLVAMERYMSMRQGWLVWEESGVSSIERRTEALQKLWDAREINMSDFLLQVRQTLETRTTALDLRQTIWTAWIEYLGASNGVEPWLGAITNTPNPKTSQISMRQN